VARVLSRVDVDPVGATTSVVEARNALDQFQPNLLITDVRVEGDEGGLDLISYGLDRIVGLRAIVLSMYDDPDHIDRAFAAGAAVYVLKSTHPDDLATAVRQLSSKSIFFASTRRPVGAQRTGSSQWSLTRREIEILRLVAEGQSNAEVARGLWLSEQTVKYHLSNIFRKLQVGNRTEASRWAQSHGLLAGSQVLRVLP
jgi:DNA-binding NarL/FixJ family response regulator